MIMSKIYLGNLKQHAAAVESSEVKDTEATVNVKVTMKKECNLARTENIKLVKVKDEWKVNL